MLLVFPSMVRAEIVAQHEKLRGLARQTLAEISGRSFDLGGLERRAREVHESFREHLLFEEKALVPVLWAVDAWGPERVQDLRREHGRQRQELDAVIHGLESGWSGEYLASELARLTADLLRDMDEEEEGCLRASLLSDDHLTCERR